MRGLKTVYAIYIVGFLFLYIGYKEEARHLPKTVTLKLGAHKKNIKI